MKGGAVQSRPQTTLLRSGAIHVCATEAAGRTTDTTPLP